MEREQTEADLKREWIIMKLAEINMRRISSLQEVAEYVFNKDISKQKELLLKESSKLNPEN